MFIDTKTEQPGTSLGVRCPDKYNRISPVAGSSNQRGGPHSTPKGVPNFGTIAKLETSHSYGVKSL